MQNSTSIFTNLQIQAGLLTAQGKTPVYLIEVADPATGKTASISSLKQTPVEEAIGNSILGDTINIHYKKRVGTNRHTDFCLLMEADLSHSYWGKGAKTREVILVGASVVASTK